MVRSTFSPARAWRPAVVARLARTLGVTTAIHAPNRATLRNLPSEEIMPTATQPERNTAGSMTSLLLRRPVNVALAFALTLGACGGGSTTEPASASTTPPTSNDPSPVPELPNPPTLAIPELPSLPALPTPPDLEPSTQPPPPDLPPVPTPGG